MEQAGVGPDLTVDPLPEIHVPLERRGSREIGGLRAREAGRARAQRDGGYEDERSDSQQLLHMLPLPLSDRQIAGKIGAEKSHRRRETPAC